MLSKLAVRRLTKLADYMDGLPKSANEHFDMGALWFEHEGAHKHKLPQILDRSALRHCGTTACAAGWAAVMPEFKKQGFGLTRDGRFLIERREFFDIDVYQDDALFFYAPANTPKQWAKHCRKFLRENA